MIVAANFVGVGMNVNEALARSGNVEQRIALRSSLRLRPPTSITTSAFSMRALSFGFADSPISPA